MARPGVGGGGHSGSCAGSTRGHVQGCTVPAGVELTHPCPGRGYACAGDTRPALRRVTRVPRTRPPLCPSVRNSRDGHTPWLLILYPPAGGGDREASSGTASGLRTGTGLRTEWGSGASWGARSTGGSERSCTCNLQLRRERPLVAPGPAPGASGAGRAGGLGQAWAAAPGRPQVQAPTGRSAAGLGQDALSGRGTPGPPACSPCNRPRAVPTGACGCILSCSGRGARWFVGTTGGLEGGLPLERVFVC